MISFAEQDYENAILELFRDRLGYDTVYGPDVVRDYANPLYMDELRPALRRLNPTLPPEALDEAINKLRRIEADTLPDRNRQFMHYLQNGLTVGYFDPARDEQRSDLVYLVDYDDVTRNRFVAANQWTVEDFSVKRPDVIIFINGLPLVVFELKSPSREETDASEAYRQLRNYMQEIPSLFVCNAFCVISDLATSRAGTITSGEDRFMEWKTSDGKREETQQARFDTFFEGIFDKARLLDIIRNFICFSGDAKIMAAYHQYFAVLKAIDSTVEATGTDGKGGVFWHTQGSGKSLSMVFYAQLLQSALQSPTIVVLTDRNDLDGQLHEQFAKCAAFLRQAPEQAGSRAHLKRLLAGRKANGIIFTTTQKFEESDEELSDRRNIIVIADEAHRSQFIDEKVDSKTGRVRKSFGLLVRESLPNATFIGFTGTPISRKDRSTVEVFGDYIDKYDMTQAVQDGATVPVYYESRVIHLKLDDATLRLIDEEYDLMADAAEPYLIEKSKKKLAQMETILGADQTIAALCQDIVDHYENNRALELTGKALIVAYSRAIAMRIYRKLLELRPAWSDLLGVVMTESNNDPEEWREIIGNKRHRDEMAKRFKNDDDPLKIAIVVDMWLTGFDVPSLATMYVYKPMAGHNLMQAIARVNRVYPGKVGGLIVDYVGIAAALKEAMRDYTSRDQQNYGEMDIARTAARKFAEKLEVCRDLFHGYDYGRFMAETASDLDRAQAIIGGVNFLSGVDKSAEREAYIKEALLLRQALSLCRSLLDPAQRREAAYFEAIRTLLTRITTERKPLSLREINDRINELLKQSIHSEGVINLFSDVDMGLSLFDPQFLDEIARMKQRNLAVELLRKLLTEQVTAYRTTNLVRSEKFSERLARIMNAYINGQLSNEQVIEELLRMAQEMAGDHEKDAALNLTPEEIAFYDALTKPEAVKDFYDNEQLVAITRELTEALRKSRTIDWQKKESARAGMRRMVKKLLKKHKYPPEGMEDAIATVIGQCELWADN